MSLFEDLVDELKSENLLEETVIETRITESGIFAGKNTKSTKETENHDVKNDFGTNSPEFADAAPLPEEIEHFAANVDLQPKNKKLSEKEFYQKRAMEEVSGLQMVEHVLSGIEREQMKQVPKGYDDLAVKKTLHAFMQVADDTKSTEHAQAEFSLMQETENWCSALSYRDKRISIAHLRRFCETTKPPLSSQALISLARFYRNLAFSESVRNKFDFIITRLFTKDVGGEKRFLVFDRAELTGHLEELYADWSSIQFHSGEEYEKEITPATEQFEAFISEAENSQSFDKLIETTFFNRLRSFKENTHELFFAPPVAAAAIECNIRIGNKYIDLIEQERELSDAETLQDKYGFLHDQAISDATSKTLQLVELLKERSEEAFAIDDSPEEKSAAKKTTAKSEKISSREKFLDFSKVDRKLLIFTALVFVICIGLYFWANYSNPAAMSKNVLQISLENTPYGNFIKTARVADETLYGILLPEWDKSSHEKKTELLQALLNDGKTKGYSKVLLLNENGKNAASAGKGILEIND